MRFLNALLSHSIFIAFCALGISYETTFLLNLPTQNNNLLFIFFATLSSYNFYWVLSKYYFSKNFATLIKSVYGHLAMIVIGLLGVLYFYNHSNINSNVVLVSMGITCLYCLPLLPFKGLDKLQKIGFLKTFLLAFCWAYVTCLIPIEVDNVFTIPFVLLFINRFLFIYMLCILFDLRDVEKDKANGFESMATKIDDKKVGKYFILLLILFFLTKLLFLIQTNNLINLIATFLMCLVLLKTFYYSLLQKNYYFYYFYVDGLMLVSMLLNVFI